MGSHFFHFEGDKNIYPRKDLVAPVRAFEVSGPEFAGLGIELRFSGVRVFWCLVKRVVVLGIRFLRAGGLQYRVSCLGF